VSIHGGLESQSIQVLSFVLMQFLQIALTGKKIQTSISTTVEQEEDTSSTVKSRRFVDAVMMQMQLQISMIQIEDLIYISYQLIMASLVNLSTTTPSKKASASMIMEQELEGESKIGSAIEHVKRHATMILIVMLSRLAISHATPLTQLTIGKETTKLITRSP